MFKQLQNVKLTHRKLEGRLTVGTALVNALLMQLALKLIAPCHTFFLT